MCQSRDRAHAKNCRSKSLLHCTESLEHGDIEIFVFLDRKMNITAEFVLPSMTQS